MLQDLTSDPKYLFNPSGWMFDEAGANWDAVEKIFGNDARKNRCVSCKFHFYQCARRQTSNWSEKAKTTFNDIVRSICEAPTPYQYQQARHKLMTFSNEKKGKRGHIVQWFKWWHTRRTHVFNAFKCSFPLTPNVNLAEVGHSKWAKKDAYRLSLARAAEEDVAEAILLSKKLQAFGGGTYKGGKHRSQTNRLQLTHSQEVLRAKAFGEEFANSVVETSIYENAASSREIRIDPNCSHRATKKGRKIPTAALDSSSDSDDEFNAGKGKSKSREGRFRSKPSRAFSRSLEMACKGHFSLLDSEECGEKERSFTLRSDSNTYQVIISKTPTCDCPYSSNTNICKHVIHVLLTYFNVSDKDYILYQRTFSSDEVTKLFANLHLENRTNNVSLKKQSTSQNRQEWLLTKLKSQPGPKPSCANYNCKKVFQPGDLCISVEGMYTPPNKDSRGNSFDVKRIFRFCVQKTCLSAKPKYSNLQVPPEKITFDRHQTFSGDEVEKYVLLFP